MAQEVTTHLVDDLDGGKADATVEFGLDGQSYSIDLSAPNAQRLREIIQGYAAHGRRVKRAKAVPRIATSRRGPRPTGLDREQLRAVRDWARRHGYPVNERGRISDEVLAAFREAHPVQSNR